MLGVSLAPSRRLRAGVTLTALAGLAVLAMRLPLQLTFSPGDYGDFVADRTHFADYMGVNGIQFQYHLSSQLVRGIDAVLGQTDASMAASFAWLLRLATLLLLGGVAVLAHAEGWSERAVRYAGLAAGAPTMVLFFGYREFGLLPAAIEAWAIPLGLIALDRDRPRLFALAAGLLGVGAALHGFGLFGLVFMLLVGLVWTRSVRQVANAAAYGVLGWVGWVPLYTIVLHSDLVSGHSHELPLRPLLHSHFSAFYHRTDEAIVHSLPTIGYEFLIVGVPALLLLPFVRSRLRLAVGLAALPLVLGVIVWWPVQGIGGDADYLASAFPAFYGTAWLAAPSRRLAAALFGLLVVGHLAIHHALASMN